MKKYLITITIILATLWFSLTTFMNSVMANEYNKAVIANVIQNKVNGTNVDVSKLMEQELEKIAHQFALESLTVIQQYLPTILEGVLTEMRLKADKEYKCALLKDSKIKDKQCE